MTAQGCDPPDANGSPEAVVRAFLGELGRHDVDGAMALLDHDFVFRNPEGTFSVGRGQMRAALAWDAAALSQVQVEQLRSAGDTVRALLVERNRFSELLALDPWIVDVKFIVQDGRIVEEVAREVTNEGPTFTERFERALEPVRRWAAEARPADARSVFEAGRVARYDGATAQRLLALIEGYNRESGGNR